MNGGKLGRQFSDLVAFVLLPLTCLLMPLAAGEWLLERCARSGWVLRSRSRQACAAAARLVSVDDAEAWRRRWRQVELVDARDAWFLLFGRRRGLLNQVRVDGDWPGPGPNAALVGLHWGPGVLALELFRAHGLAPRFVHRPANPAFRRQAPFQYLYLKVLVRVIGRCCDGQAIEVPGARPAIEAALDEGATPVLLLDAPPPRGRRTRPAALLGREVALAADGMEMLARRGVRCTPYALGLDRADGKALVFMSAVTAEDANGVVAGVSALFDRFVGGDSAQWRLWHVAGQLFEPEDDA